jgi:hypothetical protein
MRPLDITDIACAHTYTHHERRCTMMTNPSDLNSFFRDLSAEELRSALATFVPPNRTQAERVAAIESVLNSPNGVTVRAAMGSWISEHIVPASKLVPSAHVRWIPVVRDAMIYVVSHLSSSRLAPKLLEQLFAALSITSPYLWVQEYVRLRRIGRRR